MHICVAKLPLFIFSYSLPHRLLKYINIFSTNLSYLKQNQTSFFPIVNRALETHRINTKEQTLHLIEK